MRFQMRNWPAKILSLGTALGLLWYVQATRIGTRDIQVRVDSPKLRDNLIIASKVPPYLKVKLRGPRELLDLPLSDFKIRLSNPYAQIGQNAYKAVLEPELPEGIYAEYNDTVEIKVDEEETRTLPVYPRVEMKLPPNLRVGYAWVVPRTINVRGPAEQIADLDRIHTRTIVIEDGQANKVTTKKEFLAREKAFVNPAPGEPYDVEYHVLLLPKNDEPPEDMVDIKLRDVTPVCLDGPRGYKVEPARSIDVVVRVKKGYYVPAPRYLASQFQATAYCFRRWYDKRQALEKEGKGDRPIEIDNILISIEDKYKRDYISVRRIVRTELVALRFQRIYGGATVRKAAICQFTQDKAIRKKHGCD